MAFVKVDTDFIDKTSFVVKEINEGVMDWLDDSGHLLQQMVAAHTEKDTGNTANSWKYEVKRDSKTVASCEVKSDNPNASFEEFGTGIYAEEGHYPWFKGRIPWVYMDDRGNFHRTEGKRAQHPAQRACEVCFPVIRENGKKFIL